LACVDSIETMQIMARLRDHTTAPIIIVATKGDIISEYVKQSADIVVSAYTGEGLSLLLSAIECQLQKDQGEPLIDAPALTRTRHHMAVTRAQVEMENFLITWRDQELPIAVAATHVRSAGEALGELIGVVQVNDVLDTVFGSFCVGK
jgi:tRNA modification GTPase